MQKILLSILIIAISPLFIFAQSDTTIDQVKAVDVDKLNTTQQGINSLGFTLPQYTDNPSYIITFKDISPNTTGIEIDIDGKGFTKITSPYTFPALSIGKHTIKFRFNDETDAVRTLEYELIVIPRAPLPSTPQINDDSITITGSALANSDVIYFLSANAFNTTGIVKTNENGSWSIIIKPEEGLADGIYTFTSYTRKYGYASILSTPLTFSIGKIANSQIQDNTNSKEIFFSFDSITKDNFTNIFKQNNDLILLIVGVFLFGVIITIVLKSLIFKSKEEIKIKEVEKLITDNKNKKEKEPKTLREIFGDVKNSNPEKEEEIPQEEPKESDKEETNNEVHTDSENNETEEENKEETEKKETVINKDVFLRKYKMVDPDDESGKEVKNKKKIKISLTSKSE